VAQAEPLAKQPAMTYLIGTDRLVLRDLEPRDEDTLAAMLADEEVMRWIGAGGAQVGDVARRVIERERGHYAERGWGEWATTERDSGRMIGLCGLILWPDIEGREELEVSYILARDAWGRGYATEAAAAVRDVGRTIRPDLVSLIYPDNAASIRVAHKIGMTYEKDVDFQGHQVGLYRQELIREYGAGA
jgi:RimJ/RimL family protein N-acetyltransferase